MKFTCIFKSTTSTTSDATATSTITTGAHSTTTSTSSGGDVVINIRDYYEANCNGMHTNYTFTYILRFFIRFIVKIEIILVSIDPPS